MITEEFVRQSLSESNLGALRRAVRSGPLSQMLDAFHAVIGGHPERSPLDHALFMRAIHARDKLAGILLVARDLQVPHWNAFGPFALSQGDATNDYDLARNFIVTKRVKSSRFPAAGLFYPEVARLDRVNRVIALADAHVKASPDGIKMSNLYSLRARLTLADARLAAKPNGTTCALFLRAVLVAAGDLRFVANTDKLMINRPGSGHMAYGLGVDYAGGKSGGAGLKNPDRPGHSPANIQRGDLYYIDGSDRVFVESGHVGLIADVRKKADAIQVMTIDGGQMKGDGLYAGGHGWWTKKKPGLFEYRNGHWEKKIQDEKGDFVRFPASVSRYENNQVAETKYAFRTLRYWVALREVGAFEQLATA